MQDEYFFNISKTEYTNNHHIKQHWNCLQLQLLLESNLSDLDEPVPQTQTMTAPQQKDWQQQQRRRVFHFEAVLSRPDLEWAQKEKGLLDESYSKLHVIIVSMCLCL